MPLLTSLANVTAEQLARRAKTTGILGLPTGIPGLDPIIDGWQRELYSVLVGDSGIGKSMLLSWTLMTGAKAILAGARPSFTVNSTNPEQSDVINAERAKKPPLMVLLSLEMSAMMVSVRMLTESIYLDQGYHVDSAQLLQGKWPKWLPDAPPNGNWASTADVKRLKAGIDAMAKYGQHVYAEFDCVQLGQIRKLLTRLSEDYDICFVGVDYFRLIQDVTEDGNMASRQELISTGLKSLAKDFSCHVMAIVDINREGQKAGAPALYHIKGGTSVQFDADLIMLLARLDDQEDSFVYRLGLTIGKNRVGQTGELEMMLHAQSAVILDPPRTDFYA